jgi:hypothetical protein
MEDLRTQTELPAAKLRSIGHYCPQVKDDRAMQHLCSNLADKVQGVDATMTTREFKG